MDMGPRRHGFNPSKKASQKDGNTKHTKSLKNKVRDVQRLLKKVGQVVNLSLGSAFVLRCIPFVNAWLK